MQTAHEYLNASQAKAWTDRGLCSDGAGLGGLRNMSPPPGICHRSEP